MKNYLFGPNGLATKIVHTRYLSRWIVMGIDASRIGLPALR